jgi:uncharacterized protein YecT (DUF1311 family)
MKTIGVLAIAAGVTAPVVTAASTRDDPRASKKTQTDMNRIYDHELEVADAELDKVYEDAMTQASSGRTKDALRHAERAWIKYRDSECMLETLGASGGSAYPVVATICLTIKINARTQELQEVLDSCKREGDFGCPFR